MSKIIYTITAGLLIGVLIIGIEEIKAHHPHIYDLFAVVTVVAGFTFVIRSMKHDK